jgi:hypothetical protein
MFALFTIRNEGWKGEEKGIVSNISTLDNCSPQQILSTVAPVATLFWLKNSDFKASCHIAPFLRLLVPKKPTDVSPFLLLQGLHIKTVTTLMNGAMMPHWLKYYCFHLACHPVFIPCIIGLALLLSSCSRLFRALLNLLWEKFTDIKIN